MTAVEEREIVPLKPTSGFAQVTSRLRTWHVLTLVAVAFEFTTSSSYAVYISTLIVFYAIAALGQGLLVGKTGQVALGGAAVMMIGAEVAGIVDATPVGTVFLIPLAAGVLASATAGLVVGVPGLRFKGLYLILATLALQSIASFAAQKYETAHAPGGVSTQGLRLGSVTIQADKLILAVMCLFLVAVLLWIRRIYRGPIGRMLQVIKERDDAAAVFGINVRAWKLWAFVWSSAITGLAGGLMVYFLRAASYQSFDLTIAINLLVMVYIGGAGTIAGPIIGAALITYAPTAVNWVANTVFNAGSSGWMSTNISVIERLIYGLALLLVLLYQPAGINGFWQNTLRRIGALLRRGEVA
ncbi:MAG: branched-chain amino acid ABC transporter permease [Marmoricola sp.]